MIFTMVPLLFLRVYSKTSLLSELPKGAGFIDAVDVVDVSFSVVVVVALLHAETEMVAAIASASVAGVIFFI